MQKKVIKQGSRDSFKNKDIFIQGYCPDPTLVRGPYAALARERINKIKINNSSRWSVPDGDL
jgi:hypothetical protein